MITNKHVHFIGICGVAMSALALSFHKLGYYVSGSDKGFYPPVSEILKKTSINFYPGWQPDKMILPNKPDFVVVGNVAGSQNPEFNYVKKHNIPYYSYPEIIEKYLITKKSIVCAGTYGKTTISALLSWIFTKLNLPTNYLFGGLVNDNNFPASQIVENANWSIVEGDEYKTAPWDLKPKFFKYHPQQLILTALNWDHAEIYPNLTDYNQVFIDLVNSLPNNGLLVISERIKNKFKNYPNLISYGQNLNNDFYYQNIKLQKKGLEFDIYHQNKKTHIKTKLLGEYMADNITAVWALCSANNLNLNQVKQAIAEFPGLKRRLELRYENSQNLIFDDIAHSPTKVKAVLKTLKQIYPQEKIISVFEPNTGNREKKLASDYNQAFNLADLVIIPRLSHLKKSEHKYLDGEELSKIINQYHQNTIYLPDDNELINFILNKRNKYKIIVFLGSHGFRRMIEILIDKFKQYE